MEYWLLDLQKLAFMTSLTQEILATKKDCSNNNRDFTNISPSVSGNLGKSRQDPNRKVRFLSQFLRISVISVASNRQTALSQWPAAWREALEARQPPRGLIPVSCKIHEQLRTIGNKL